MTDTNFVQVDLARKAANKTFGKAIAVSIFEYGEVVTLADADEWVEIAMFAGTHQDYLWKYIIDAPKIVQYY